MKLLFVTKDWSQGIEKNTVYFSQALSRHMMVMEWNEPGDLKEIVNKQPYKPDFILLNDMRATRCPQITGIKSVDIPVGIIMHDLNHLPEERKAFIRENNIRYLFVHYRSFFHRHYSEFSKRMIWLPHWVNTEVFKDYGLPKSYDYLLMGCINQDIYPLRSTILERMQSLRGFMHHPHPGYHYGKYNENDFIVGQRYAKEINKAKLFLTDDSIYHNTFMKYFEVPACNTLLLASNSEDAKDLGFIPSINFVEISEQDFFENARYYAQNYETVGRQIARSGYEMVRSRHSVELRAKQFADAAHDILKRG